MSARLMMAVWTFGIFTVSLPAHWAPVSTPPAFASTYSKINLDRCKVIEKDEESDYWAWRCPGFRQIPIFVEVGDERFDVDAGVRDNDPIDSDTFDETPSIVEWRLNRGKPFAIIYRLTVANPDAPKTSRLLVETVGRPGRRGCRVASIPGSIENANEIARIAADRILGGSAPCLQKRNGE